MGIRSDLQTELKRLLQSEIIRGKVAVQRAYADWRRYPQYIVPLSESSIDLIFAPAYGSNKKNATDIRLAIDALELVFTRPEIGTFILLTGGSDFSSLVLKLKEYGKYVIGVGIRESSSDLLIQNCDEYYSYNELAGLTKESDVTHERHDHQVPGIVPLVRDVALFREAGQLVVGVVLVAVLDQQVARRLADPHADDVLAVLLELQHEGRKIGIARQQDERADLGPREHELEGVDGETDVRCVLLVRPVRRRPDHVDRGFRERDDVLRVAAPIGVGALYSHLPLDDVRLQQAPQLRLEIRADPHRHIVEVDHERRVGRVGRGFVVYRSWQVGLRRLRHVVALSSRPTTCASSRRFTFPLPVSGNVSKKRTRSGTLWSATASWQKSLSSSPVTMEPSVGTTHAQISSPSVSLGMPTTQASPTAGCVRRRSSSSRG